MLMFMSNLVQLIGPFSCNPFVLTETNNTTLNCANQDISTQKSTHGRSALAKLSESPRRKHHNSVEWIARQTNLFGNQLKSIVNEGDANWFVTGTINESTSCRSHGITSICVYANRSAMCVRCPCRDVYSLQLSSWSWSVMAGQIAIGRNTYTTLWSNAIDCHVTTTMTSTSTTMRIQWRRWRQPMVVMVVHCRSGSFGTHVWHVHMHHAHAATATVRWVVTLTQN